MQNTIFDIVIIGSGPGGYRAAVLAALQKKTVAIIEKHQWGGCCLNRGCVPKKAWHQTATLINQIEQIKLTGVTGHLHPDFTQAWLHQQSTSQQVRNNYTDYMKRLGIQAIEGHAQLRSNRIIEIQKRDATKQTIEARNIILATGSKPLFPENVTPASRLLSTDDLFETPPPAGNDVAIIGSGVIATELAFILARLGKNIHWFSRSEILRQSSFSEQARQVLKDAFVHAQISLPTSTTPSSYHQKQDKVELVFADNSIVEVDWVLFATGRKPYTEQLGIENTQITLDKKGFIQTNHYLQTDEENIFAIGDVRAEIMTANQAISDANIVIANIIDAQTATAKTHEIPQAIYSCVEMARIGLSEEEAEDNDYEPATGFTAFESSPTAIGQNETAGFLRVIADMDSGKFLGSEIIGKNAGELIHLLSANYGDDAALYKFAQLVVNHPSRSEEIVNAVETLANKWNMESFIFEQP